MADTVRLISIRRGYDPREFALVVFGGAGALHGADLARELSIPTVIVPPNPGITSALGCLLVDVRHDITEMYLAQVATVDPAAVEAEFQKLEHEARERLAAEDVPPEQMSLERLIDMRYLGQWRSLSVPVEAPLDLEQAAATFHAEHLREYNFRRDDAPVEIYRLNVKAIGVTPKAELARHEPTGETPSPRSRRPVTFFESGRPGRHAGLPARRPARGLRVRGPGDRRGVRLHRRRPAGLARRGGRVAEHPTARPGGSAMSTKSRLYTLDPVTFEVLKNAFTNTVDQMAEQILRTCHSFVIFARDFSSSLCDVEGNTIMQGSQDIAVHVGTLHYTCKAVIEAFEGDIHPGDVFAINDPYLGGTHFNDVRIIRPIFVDGEVIAYAQSNGHWADVGGTVPGSFDINAKEHFGEGLRIPPIRIWDKGKYLGDIVRMFASNTRAPDMIIGDLQAQAEATRVAEREILRLVEKYGKPTIMTAFSEVQDYVEILTRRRIAEMPDGVWETEDYIDYDPSIGEGLIPIKVKMTIEGDQLSYDLSGSHPAVGTFLNAGFGSAFSGVIAGTKTFFPDVPLNSGFYRAVQVDLGPVGSVVNAPWPIAVTGFCSGPYEKIMNAIFELWSKLMPERALACSFNLEYLLVGGRDARLEDKPYFMWYDWMVGGWGGRNGRDGSNCTAPIFGVGPRGAAARGPGAPLPGRHDAARDPHRLRRARASSAAAAASRRARR